MRWELTARAAGPLASIEKLFSRRGRFRLLAGERQIQPIIAFARRTVGAALWRSIRDPAATRQMIRDFPEPGLGPESPAVVLGNSIESARPQDGLCFRIYNTQTDSTAEKR